MLKNIMGPDLDALGDKIDHVTKQIRGAYMAGGRQLGVEGTIRRPRQTAPSTWCDGII